MRADTRKVVASAYPIICLANWVLIRIRGWGIRNVLVIKQYLKRQVCGDFNQEALTAQAVTLSLGLPAHSFPFSTPWYVLYHPIVRGWGNAP
jgi:hypothetical protein